MWGNVLSGGSRQNTILLQDHPVGNDNHRVNGRQLFDAKMNHASLLPVTSLMKAEDFLGSEALNVDHHSGRNSSGKRPAHLTSKVVYDICVLSRHA